MTPDEHAAEAERILASLRKMIDSDNPPTHLDVTANLARAQVHATLSTRQPEPESILRTVVSDRRDWQKLWDDHPAAAPPARYRRATTATGYAIWQHQMSADGERCMQVKSFRYLPSNWLSADGEVPPTYCACQGRDSVTEPGTWLPVYVPTADPTTEPS